MIIWRGWGALIVLAGVVVGGLVAAIGQLGSPGIAAIMIFVGGVIGGIVIHLLARRLDRQPGRTLVDPKTGETVVLRKTAGSLFFIPTRFWAFILPVVYAFVAISVWADPSILKS